MPSIDAEVNPEQFVSRYFGGTTPDRLRQSEARRGRLERWARVVGHDNVSLSLNPTSGETARVIFNGDAPNIEIPSWEIPQPVTEIQREVYDFLLQRTMTLHEVGHVNYTDQDELETAISAVNPDRVEQFHTIWNALEDGAIETQLRGDFSVADEIEIMNANYMGSHGRSKTYGVMDAALRACLDLAVYDTGDLRTLLDETDTQLEFNNEQARETFEDDVLPEIRSSVPDIITEGDPAERTEAILDLWNRIKPAINPDEEPTLDDIDAKGDHATQESGSGSFADQLEDIDSTAVDDRIDSILNRLTDANRETTDEQSSDTADQDPDDTKGGQSGSSADGTRTERDQSSHQTDSEANSSKENNDEDPTEEQLRQTTDRTDESSTEKDDGPTDTDQGQNGASQLDPSSQEEVGLPDISDANGNRDESQSLDSVAERDESGKRPENCSQRQSTDSDDSDDSDSITGADITDDQASDSADGSSVGASSGIQTNDIDRDPDPDPALEDGYLEQIEAEQSQRRDNLDTLEAEVDAFARSLERLEEQDETPTELEVPIGGDVRRAAWPNTRRQGTQLRQILEDSLRQEQRSGWRRGRPSGQIDARSLPRIARSDPRVFRQRISPDEKDYSAALVLDRSGSMSGEVTHAEEATVALAYALEEIDIDTCVIDMCHSRPRLAKPYGCRVEPALDSLLTGETGGGTPLSDAIRLARERVKDRDGTPFCIVITDGQPDDQDEYLEELRKTSFPVVGVYLAFGKSGPDSVSRSVRESANLFDQRQIVTDESRLVASLRGLCREVMF